MRLTLAIAALALLPTAALADDAKAKHPQGAFIGHDGKLWKMEGCAAYPVDAKGNALPLASVPAAPAKDAPKKLAQSKTATE